MADNRKVCVDASVVIKLVISENDSEKVEKLWADWISNKVEITAPFLLALETGSVLRNRVWRKEITQEEGETAFEITQSLKIAFLNPDFLYKTAWGLAKQFNLPTIYDSCYLALAQILEAPFWTADMKLYHAVGNKLKWVKWLEDYKEFSMD
ncbi:MAG: type II toxin-antitoxin system VapC family toxin [bacterium]